MKVAAITLLKGAWYAIEQCGRLLQDSGILYRAKAYSTASAVALLAQEELGLYRFLRGEWERAVETGVEPDVEAIKAVSQDHIQKQQCAQLSVMYVDRGGGGLGALHRKMLTIRRAARSTGKHTQKSII